MAENNQTSMTPEVRWGEVQKWVAWVDAQRLLGGRKPAVLLEYIADSRLDQEVLKNWAAQPQEPTGSVLHIIWTYPELTKKILNKGETQ